MSIVYNADNSTFIIETKNTEYVFQILNKKYTIHLYYGEKNNKDIKEYKSKFLSFSPYHEGEEKYICQTHVCRNM